MHLIFLPGASGAAEFWHPLGKLLPAEWEKTYMSWPGLGNQAHDAAVNHFDDLALLTARKLKKPTIIVAQSMGGIVGVRLALQFPKLITSLILVATSGGIDVSSLGGTDWRDVYLKSFPYSKTWITTENPDHSNDIQRIICPTLLLWGDRDPISSVSVGQQLSKYITHSTLHVIEDGDHDLGKEKATEIAPLVIAHLWEQSNQSLKS